MNEKQVRRKTCEFLIPLVLCVSLPLFGSADPESRTALLNETRDALGHYREGRYASAAAQFEAVMRKAERLGAWRACSRACVGLGAASTAYYQYQKAILLYPQCRAFAKLAKDREALIAISVNLSSLFSFLGDAQAALGALQEAERLLTPKDNQLAVDVQTTRARIELAFGPTPEAMFRLEQAMQAAADLPDFNRLSQVWGDYGNMMLSFGAPLRAEEAFVEQFRLRKIHSLPNLDVALWNLGKSSLARRQYPEALRRFERAAAARGESKSTAIPWLLEHDTARTLYAMGREEAALEGWRRAMRMAGEWRADAVPPVTSFVTGADAAIEPVVSAFVDAAMTMAERRREPRLAREALEALETARAAGLRRISMISGRPRAVDVEYAELLARWQMVLSTAGTSPADLKQRREVEARLVGAEARLNGESESSGSRQALGKPDLSRRMVGEIREDEASLTFYCGDDRSWAWAQASGKLVFYPLPACNALGQQITALVAKVRGRTAAAADLERMGTELLEPALPLAGRKAKWRMSLDGPLFELPWMALRLGGRYLIEDHAAVVVASLKAPRFHEAPGDASRLVVMGDAVYNRADARYQRRYPEMPEPISPMLRVLAHSRVAPEGQELPRLAASKWESNAVAARWRSHGGKISSYEGWDVNRKQLMDVLSGPSPAVVHLAAHTWEADMSGTGAASEYHNSKGLSGGNKARVLSRRELALALSITEAGGPEPFTAADAAASSARGTLIVLSGCSSGSGTVQPGAGLLGFTHAWMAAGAEAVVGTLWPVRDADNKFFENLYAGMHKHLSPSEAMRQAQLRLARDPSTKADPAEWASYFVVGKE